MNAITQSITNNEVKTKIKNYLKSFKTNNEMILEDMLEFMLYLRELYLEHYYIPQIIELYKSIKDKIDHFINVEFSKKLAEKNIDFDTLSRFNISHWYLDFYNAFSGPKMGFDFIIGNPPYLFTKYKELTQDEKLFYRKDYYGNLLDLGHGDLKKQSGKINICSLFIIKSVRLLKSTYQEEGIVSFVLPNSILRATTMDTDRKFILNETEILKIIDLGKQIFKDVTTATILLFLKKQSNQRLRDTNRITIGSFNKKKSNIQYMHEIEQSSFKHNISNVFCIYLTPRLQKIFTKIRTLSDELEIFTKAHIEGIICKKEDYDIEKNINFTDSQKNWKPFLKGRDIAPFEIKTQTKYINYDPDNLHRPREEHIFTSEQKIISQRIVGGARVLVAALDDAQHYTFSSINNFIKHRHFSYDYYFFLALLNSNLLNTFYRINYTNNSLLTVNISKTFLNSLPIYRVNFNDNREKKLYHSIVNNIQRLIEAKKIISKLLTTFDHYLLQFNMNKKVSLSSILKDSIMVKLYTLQKDPTKRIDLSTKEYIKEYKIELYEENKILILYRVKSALEFKAVLELEFKNTLLKEYFFFSMRKDTEEKKQYRSKKSVEETLKKDLFLRINSEKSNRKNLKLIEEIMNNMKSQFKVNFSNLNKKVISLEQEINKMIFELYRLDEDERQIILQN
ncbi:MAG: hypothetical protein BAJALOKI1v1_1890001 [Promethearchaeota archaeon]|nr:MAG: hypothetical protein BAJALOKI1v1_1890001 [Candidatus Lokiarchaeota archaeon]